MALVANFLWSMEGIAMMMDTVYGGGAIGRRNQWPMHAIGVTVGSNPSPKVFCNRLVRVEPRPQFELSGRLQIPLLTSSPVPTLLVHE